jgi:hypothetical protein
MKVDTAVSLSSRATMYRIVADHVSGFSSRDSGVPSMNKMNAE